MARRPLRIAAATDYEEMSEPNMKLSRALLIVLVLHVVAVAGIIAFNAIKTRQASLPPARTESADANSLPAIGSAVKPSAPIPKPAVARDESKPAHAAAKPIAKEQHKIEPAKPSAKGNAPSDSGKVYVVVKGDNPVTIAKKLGVSYDELIELNHIEDPRKLQVGQKLLIPSKPAKAKKDSE